MKQRALRHYRVGFKKIPTDPEDLNQAEAGLTVTHAKKTRKPAGKNANLAAEKKEKKESTQPVDLQPPRAVSAETGVKNQSVRKRGNLI